MLVRRTPVEPLRWEGDERRGAADLWVKRDDLTDPLYGGNKVRKLQYVFSEAHRRGVRRVVTIGAVGSHHVLATTVHGRRAGFEVEAVLVPQPTSTHAQAILRADLAQGLVAYPAPWWILVPYYVVASVLRGAWFIPVGGSSALGSLGYVDAARELASQIRAGELPEPDEVVVAVGSGGTAAGLAVGLALEGLRTRVHGIVVAEPPWAVRLLTRRLVGAVARTVGHPEVRADALARLDLDGRYLGRGYGVAEPWGDQATLVARSLGLGLDPTYTAKTFAAALDAASMGDRPTVLYWHTLSSAPLLPLLEGPGADSQTAHPNARLLRLLTE